MPRFFCPGPLAAGESIQLPGGAARHVQVLRLQPGAGITLFDGHGGEFEAVVEHMGRSEVRVRIGQHHAVEREAPLEVLLAVGMPANERMDWLVEKATELGVAGIQPLAAERSVLKLTGERAAKKQAHWQGIAVGACEQCGRNRVPLVYELRAFGEWIAGLETAPLGSPAGLPASARWLLSLGSDAPPLPITSATGSVTLLSGPEGGLSPSEEAAALAAGFHRCSLGPRVLRAETAPLAALSLLACGGDPSIAQSRVTGALPSLGAGPLSAAQAARTARPATS
jgi:16S rRNA (uracil1498-N3)-methyltransferase